MKKRFPSKRTVYLQTESCGIIKKSSSSSTISALSSNSSGQHKSKENESISPNVLDDSSSSKPFLGNNGTYKKEKTILDYLIMEYSNHQKSTNDWLCSSAPDGTMAKSNKSYKTANPGRRMKDTSTQMVQREEMELLDSELSDLESQNHVTKESNCEEILLRKLNSLKGERDGLKRECEQLKASQRKTDDEDDANWLHSQRKSTTDIEEIKQELKYERSINANLRLQLQKTQEANSELILAVQDLEELLEQKNRETRYINCSKISIKQLTEDNVTEIKFNERNSHVHISECDELFRTTSDGKEEQYKLDVLAKGDGKVKDYHSLEQKIEELNSLINTYNAQQEDTQVKMDKLALDYENLKEENKYLHSKLGQAQKQEIMRHDSSEHSITANYLEEEVRILKKELQEHSKAYQANLVDIMKAKLQEEKRATQAEERLQLIISNNANIAERLQEEFITLDREISSTFHINEKLAIQALAEANEMYSQKCHLENLLEQTKELTVLQHRYDAKFLELSEYVESKTKQIERLIEKLKVKSEENDNQKKSEEVKLKTLKEEILMLEAKVKTLSAEKVQLSEQIGHYQRSTAEIEQLKMSNKEIETKLQEKILEKEKLNSELASMKEKAVKSKKDLQKLHQIVEEKDILMKNLNSDVVTLTERSENSNSLSVKAEMENEDLKEQIFNMQSNIWQRDQKITILEKKLKENSRSANSEANMKITDARNKTFKPSPASQGSNKVIVLREKIKLLEANLMSKDTEVGETRILFLHEEKNLKHRTEELEKGNCQCRKQAQLYDKEEQNVKHDLKGKSINSIHNDEILRTEVIRMHKREEKSVSNNYNQDKLPEMLKEMILLKENSKAMEAELKEMQERYTEISLRFAEVEGERQQLVMIVRNLKNTLKT